MMYNCSNANIRNWFILTVIFSFSLYNHIKSNVNKRESLDYKNSTITYAQNRGFINDNLRSIQQLLKKLHDELNDIDDDLGEHNELICSKIDKLAKCDPIPIFGPTTITEPGHYCLAKGFTVYSGDGIVIASNDVVLNCNGQTIAGDSGGNGIFIYEQERILVKNGIIRDVSDSGIKIQNSSSIMIKNMKLSAPKESFAGISIEGVKYKKSNGIKIVNCESVGWGDFGDSLNGAGFKISESNQCIFKDCIARNSGTNGFRGDGFSHSCFIGCKSLSNGKNGFEFRDELISGGSNNLFVSCVAQDNTDNGFFILGTELLSLFECIANRNGKEGIFIDRADHNDIRNCVASDNGYNGIRVRRIKGFFPEAVGNLLFGCTTNNNGIHGIKVEAGETVVRNCTASGNTKNGILLVGDSEKEIQFSSNEVLNCSTNHNECNGIRIGEAPTSSIDNLVRNCIALENTKDGICLDTTTSGNKILSCVLMNNGSFGIDDDGTDNKAFNNCAQNNATNYDGIAAGIIESSPDTDTGYWANIDV